MDELKKYLQQHRDDLDLDEPGTRVWEEVRKQSAVAPRANVVMLVTRWAVAACVLALAGIGAWNLMKPEKQVTETTVAVTNAAPEKEPAIPAEEPASQPEAVKNEPEKTNTVLAKEPSVSKHNHNRTTQPAAMVNKADMRVLTDIESSFTQVINLQRARVSTMPMYAETPEYFNDFKVQLRQMEKDEKVIKADIVKRGLNDTHLDQLINLYQQKLNILKQLQFEMNKTNNRFKQNRGPVDSTRTYFLNI